ncbi:MAG: hypothetical protein EOP45_20135 [Sphingobacteriaceae bacterium]|nr:MAG: hypothetical protein EOP45_20135 [Sphingobacteriaceae bacterium]
MSEKPGSSSHCMTKRKEHVNVIVVGFNSSFYAHSGNDEEVSYTALRDFTSVVDPSFCKLFSRYLAFEEMVKFIRKSRDLARPLMSAKKAMALIEGRK